MDVLVVCCWRARAVALLGRWGPMSRSQLLTVRFGRGSQAEESSEPCRSSHPDGNRKDVQSAHIPHMPILTPLYLGQRGEIRGHLACSANCVLPCMCANDSLHVCRPRPWPWTHVPEVITALHGNRGPRWSQDGLGSIWRIQSFHETLAVEPWLTFFA